MWISGEEIKDDAVLPVKISENLREGMFDQACFRAVWSISDRNNPAVHLKNRKEKCVKSCSPADLT